MPKPRLLIASSDQDLKRRLSFLGSKVGAEPVGAASLAEAQNKTETLLPELIVLVSSNSLDAFALCRRFRHQALFLDTPIMLLVDRLEAKYQAFQAGATDVMVQPLDTLEFQFRLQVHIRARTRRRELDPSVSAGRLTLEPSTHGAVMQDQAIQLTPSEFAILRYLAARPSQAVSTEDLLVGALGEPPHLGNPQVIHTHMRNLRRKLVLLPLETDLITSSRSGYTFQIPV